MLSRYLTLALAACAVGAQAQTLFNANIDVPSSSMPQPAGTMRTHYYRLVGPWLGREGEENPVLALHGPALFAPPAGFSPSDIRAAYAIPTAAKGTEAIAVVDAFDLPTALNDFNTFSTEFNLPTETSSDVTASSNKYLQKVFPAGSQPGSNGSWGGEIALDIEWAHAMAPNAKIYLVEAASPSGPDLFAAAKFAATLPNVKEISMSWGAADGAGETTFDTYFQSPGVVYFASAGDQGGAQEYPSESAYVVGVGGTSLKMSGNQVTSETAWNGSGGGPSSVIARPAFQNNIEGIVGTKRGAPDVSLIADPNTGVAVYDSTTDGGQSGWLVIGGTSLASPVTAAITNLRGRFSDSTTDELGRIYLSYRSPFYRDITSGQAGSFKAAVGWDFITGVGSSIGLWPSLASVKLDSTSVTGGGTVHLTAAIPAALSKSITLSVISSVPALVSTPHYITIAAGQTSGSVALATGSVTGTAAQKVVLTADLDGSDLSTTLTVDPTNTSLTVTSASVSPAILTGGATTSLKVDFKVAADSTETIKIASANSALVPSISSVSVPSGKTSTTVSVPTKMFSTGAKQSVVLTISSGSSSATTTVTVMPFEVTSIKVARADIVEGDSEAATVTMTAPAPSTQTIKVGSNDSANLAPFSVTIAKGSLTGTTTVSTVRTFLTATKTATLATAVGPAKSVAVAIHPLITSFAVSPTSIKGGSTTGTTATITFYRLLGKAGTVALTPLAGITFPATAPGYSATATSVTFPITAAKVTASKAFTMTAKVDGYTRTCTLTVTL